MEETAIRLLLNNITFLSFWREEDGGRAGSRETGAAEERRGGRGGMRAHSDIRTEPGRVFAGRRAWCRLRKTVEICALRPVGHAPRFCPSVVASTAFPPFPPRRSPDTLPSHGSPLCRLVVEGDWVCVWTVSVQFAELLRLACRDYKIWLVFVTEWLIIISCRIDTFRYRYRPAGRAVCLFF